MCTSKVVVESQRADYEAGLYKLNPVDPQLESAWFQPLKLKCDFLVSKFAFKFNLYRYTWVRACRRFTKTSCGARARA